MNKKHIYIYNGQQENLLTISLLLTKSGYRVSAIKDSIEFYQKIMAIKADPKKIDLIIINFSTSNFSHLKIIEEIEKKRIDLPIFFLGDFFDEEVEELKEKKNIKLIQIPFKPSELLDYIKKALKS